MMRLKVYSTLLFLVLAFAASAQYRLSGSIVSKEDSAGVRDCVVYLNDGANQAVTDHQGRFVFKDLANGSYSVHVTSPAFRYYGVPVSISHRDHHILITLEPREELLEEILITDASSHFGMTRMHGVENMGIYEGKKSEVIVTGQLVANLATNNARQIYARVAGLNIWENDGAGLQLSIGGRGLDPNRTTNFNTRQNGYDISADALGYPESYYTPPAEGVGRIQIVRGAASLQYGTQFGGLINFEMKKPATDRKAEVVARQTVGSYGFYNAFTSVSGTPGKVSYYSFFQYKRGDGWRANSAFENYTVFANVNYKLNPRTSIGLDMTHMQYLSQQPGGLTDEMFAADPRQSNRSRNWFQVHWNLLALHLDHKLSATEALNVRAFGLSANRYSVGFRPNRVATVDDGAACDLIKGDFTNWGAEARYLNRYGIGSQAAVLLGGVRYYHGFNHSTQGFGSTGKHADFDYSVADGDISYDYRFPNRNAALFAENIFYINDKISLTPGLRYEYITTTAEGYYGSVFKDLAGNVIETTRTDEHRVNSRQFLLAGVGLGYRPTHHVEIYSNFSQNYRSITFSDMRIANPSSVIDPGLEDERGYSVDIGARSDQTVLFNYDVSYFFMNYNNRIGEVQFYDENNRVMRRRDNIGQAVIQGIECYGEYNFFGNAHVAEKAWSGVLFGNLALIRANYKASEVSGVAGNRVEFVPEANVKTGIRLGYGDINASFQYTHLSSQYTDATNATTGGVSAVTGAIPAYSVMDLTVTYRYKTFSAEASVNNLADRMYFTRRATGYPGPGILPSDGRSFFLTLQARF